MKITKRDHIVDFYSRYLELEDPNAVSAKKSSNVIYLSCMLLILLVVYYWYSLFSETVRIDDYIAEQQAYMSSPEAIEQYTHNLEYQEKITALNDYNTASVTYLEQLAASRRFNSNWVTEYDGYMQAAVGSAGEILYFSYDNGALLLECETATVEQPKIFAEYLSGLTNEDGTPKFIDVNYTGFTEQDSGRSLFTIEVILWERQATQ